MSAHPLACALLFFLTFFVCFPQHARIRRRRATSSARAHTRTLAHTLNQPNGLRFVIGTSQRLACAAQLRCVALRCACDRQHGSIRVRAWRRSARCDRARPRAAARRVCVARCVRATRPRVGSAARCCCCHRAAQRRRRRRRAHCRRLSHRSRAPSPPRRQRWRPRPAAATPTRRRRSRWYDA